MSACHHPAPQRALTMSPLVQAFLEQQYGPHPAQGEISDIIALNSKTALLGAVGTVQQQILAVLKMYFPALPADARNQAAANMANGKPLDQRLRTAITNKAYGSRDFIFNDKRQQILDELFRAWST